ncbi:MAG: cell surface protein SprA [Bacteroidia bacterium]
MLAPPDTLDDTSRLHFPLKPGMGGSHSMDLKTPEGYEKHVELDSTLENYRVYYTYNGMPVGEEELIPVEEYLEQNTREYQKDYFKTRSSAQNFVQGDRLIPKIDLGPPLLDDIFGGSFVDIRPQGSAELIFSGDINRVENPAWSVRQQRTTQFKFDQKIRMSVVGTIGDRIKIGVNYDSEASFDFDNEYKIAYEGDEDKIVRKVEAGNVSLPIPGSLITGSQELFGVKTELQFGKLRVATLFSQQKSEKKEIVLEDGAQRQEFDISALDYDANRHYFLNNFFRSGYDRYMQSLPVINSPIIVTRVEAWVTNRSGAYNNTRNIVGFMDLGAVDPYNDNISSNGGYPRNGANSLYNTLVSNPQFRQLSTSSQALTGLFGAAGGEDYSRISNARQLTQNEFQFNAKLGFISLNQPLNNDEVLAVAYEYTYNGATYQVGEFARDYAPSQANDQVLFLQLLKSENRRVDLPTWDLMMKNIYFLGSYQVQPEDFRLEVIYHDDRSGSDLNYIPESSQPQLSAKPLIRVFNLDQLNTQEEASPDGRFDYIEGVTVNSATGRIIFPVLEPFGSFLRSKFDDPALANKYVYSELYDSTQFQAEQFARLNKFFLKGYFQSAAGNEISLNAINVPEGSVRVTAGGAPLTEGQDYTVDYNLGRVTIINPSILNSGSVIKVTTESTTLFSVQQKTLMGTRLDYQFNEDFYVGGTLLHLRERPITQKVNIGDEPISNVIYGLDASYRTDSRLLTSLVDKIPFIDTKERSELLLSGEFAHLIPGHPKLLGSGGTAYIDDFEGSEVPYDMRVGNYWVHASTPTGQPDKFPNADLVNDLRYNYNRALISWYSIDQMFYRDGSNLMPEYMRNDAEMRSNHYVREVKEQEVFTNREIGSGQPGTLPTFDIAFFPRERGPYNYNVDNMDPNTGELMNPEDNWGGIMRRIETSDFEAANIEYMEFWMMDPFIYDSATSGGEIYLQLGNVSEDILKDGRKLYENGLPETEALVNVDTTTWGLVPTLPEINDAFNNEQSARQYQDVGYDGLTNENERSFFSTIHDFIQEVETKYGAGSDVANSIQQDPSGDDYRFFRGSEQDEQRLNVIERYKYYNNPDGNSPTPEQWPDDFSNSGQLQPNDEDINGDFTLSEFEDYFQYRIELRPDRMRVGENYIADRNVVPVTLPDGTSENVTWYQFKIPVQSYTGQIGQIRDFKSIRFMRMIYTGFQDSIITRFGTFQLIRGEWRRYLFDLKTPGEETPVDDQALTTFDISTVNIEENGRRNPIPYVLPPGIEREVNVNTTELLEQNEQSLALSVCELQDGDSRAAYKTITFDVRRYKNLKMFVHAEGNNLNDDELWLFIRLGTDFNNNYYEYAYPLTITQGQTREPTEIWPRENELLIPLDELYTTKIQRNNSGTGLLVPYTREFTNENGKAGIITVVGSPDLSNMRTIMMGLRNPATDDPLNPFPDNGQSLCGQVWVNELRVTDFDEEGGWAAILRATATLADFGKVTATVNRQTIGFGGIEQNLQERSLYDQTGADIQASFELGKFLPAKANVRIPMLLTYSVQSEKPKYNPLNPDLLLEQSLAEMGGGARDSLLELSETFIQRKGVTFTNVQKTRGAPAPGETAAKPRFYDIENWSLTYIYNQTYRRNPTTLYDSVTTHKGILAYNFGFNPKPVEPLKKLSNSKFLKPITDFNFFYLPQSISFRTELDRRYGVLKYRDLGEVKSILTANYDKSFRNRRIYDMRWDLTRSLKLSYSATADARFVEPPGPLDTREKKDSLWESISRLGQLMNFAQNATLSYDLPLRKLPITDWITSRTTYSATYNWIAAPPAADSLGNIAQNNRDIQINTQFNLVNLYNKITFLRNINQGKSNAEEIRKRREQQQPKEDTEGEEEEDEEEEETGLAGIKIVEGAARLLMSARNFSINYQFGRGTILPGFLPRPNIIGQDFSRNAPGLPFIFGSQRDLRARAATEGWITTDTNLTALYVRNRTKNLTAQGTLEPVKDLRITLNFSQRETENFTSNFRTMDGSSFENLSPVTNGSYSSTVIILPTAFQKLGDQNESQTFDNFENYRTTVATRLTEAGQQVDSLSSQEVLIPAFLAAYKGSDPSEIGLSAFPKLPLPNWRVNYNGLSKISFFKRFANNIVLNHGYNATYSVNNYLSSLQTNRIEIQQITIQEQFAPLIGVDITFINNVTARTEYKKRRMLSFTFSNYQLTEVREDGITIGLGYRTKDFVVPFKFSGKKLVLPNDLLFRLDFSWRNDKTLIRRLDQEITEATAGIASYSIDPVIEYTVNDNLNVRIFFKREATIPAVATSYPRSYTQFGFSLRYTLTQ